MKGTIRMSTTPPHYVEASGYEAEADRGTSEEEEELRMMCHSTTSMDGTMSTTTSTNYKRRAAGPDARRPRKWDRNASLMNLAGRRKGARNKAQSICSSNNSCCSSSSNYSSDFTTSRLLQDTISMTHSVAAEDSDASPSMFAGKTCCRHHGQHPRRHRNFQVAPHHAPCARKSRAYKASRKTHTGHATHKQQLTTVLFRGGVVRGMAANLNDSSTVAIAALPSNETQKEQGEQRYRQAVSFQLLPPIITAWNTSPAVYLSSLSTPGSKIEIATNVKQAEPPHDAISMAISPQLHEGHLYLVATAPCSIEQALSFSPRARYVLDCVLLRLLAPPGYYSICSSFPFVIIFHQVAFGIGSPSSRRTSQWCL
jgi:hypothetical protein